MQDSLHFTLSTTAYIVDALPSDPDAQYATYQDALCPQTLAISAAKACMVAQPITRRSQEHALHPSQQLGSVAVETTAAEQLPAGDASCGLHVKKYCSRYLTRHMRTIANYNSER